MTRLPERIETDGPPLIRRWVVSDAEDLDGRGPDALEIGYWIHTAVLRRGLATAVAALLTDAALSVPEITHVQIHHDKANAASAGVPRRLGYRFVGEEPDGVQAPAEAGIDVTWSIEAAEWESARARAAGELRWPQ